VQFNKETNMKSNTLPYYLAARATADWLCGAVPLSVHYIAEIPATRSWKTLEQYCELLAVLGTYNSPALDPTDFHEARRSALHRAFIVQSGLAANQFAIFTESGVEGDWALLHKDLKLITSVLEPFCITRGDANKLAQAIGDVAANVIGHESVARVVRLIADKMRSSPKRSLDTSGLRSLDASTLQTMLAANFGDGWRAPHKSSLLSWPALGRSIFPNTRWSELCPIWDDYLI
jgi:hypothetical protein